MPFSLSHLQVMKLVMGTYRHESKESKRFQFGERLSRSRIDCESDAIRFTDHINVPVSRGANHLRMCWNHRLDRLQGTSFTCDLKLDSLTV